MSKADRGKDKNGLPVERHVLSSGQFLYPVILAYGGESVTEIGHTRIRKSRPAGPGLSE